VFSISKPGGFQITFPNGLILSTQIHTFVNCKNFMNVTASLSAHETVDCNDAEIAIIQNNKYITNQCEFCDDNTVLYHVDMEKWLNIVEWCKNYKSKDRFQESI
jgi:hypothetical protein